MREIVVNNIRYSSLKMLSRHYPNIAVPTLYSRYRNGLLGNDLVAPTNKNIVVRGKSYKNLVDLHKEYNQLSYATISDRYRHGFRGDDLVKPTNRKKEVM